MNEKLRNAILVLNELCNFAKELRETVEGAIDCKLIGRDDPWVAAALNCKEDSDILDIALEFFIADIKSGFYDLKA
jgi:hypothetical protein